MPLFRILHASDFHFARKPYQVGFPEWLFGDFPWVGWPWMFLDGRLTWTGSHSRVCADALASFAYRNRQGLDGVVISGDLATTGDPGDLRVAFEFIASASVAAHRNAERRPTLQSSEKPVMLLPGNHDRFRKFHLPGNYQFDRVFAAYWHSRQSAQRLAVFQRQGATLVLLGVDFTLRKSDLGNLPLARPFGGGFLGQGRVDRRRLHVLRRLTQEAREEHPACVIIWVLHFEPAAANPFLQLLDDNLLADALQQERIAAILCGHTHLRDLEKSFAETRVFVCGTTTQHAAQSGNWFQLLEIEFDPGPGLHRIECFSYRYAIERMEFIRVESSQHPQDN